MKAISLCIAMFFYTLCVSAQDKPKSDKGFLIATAGFSKYKEISGKPYGSVMAGTALGKYASIGVGASLISIGSDKPYVPVYFQLSTSQIDKKISPYCGLHVGIGIYNEHIASVSTNGSLFVSPFMGIMFPQKKGGALILVANYLNSAFKTTIGNKSVKSNIEGFSIGIGFKMG